MKILKAFATIATISLLAACSTTVVPLNYTPDLTGAGLSKPIGVVGEVKDSRKYTGTALGSVRNGFGARAFVLELEKPASEIVRDAVNSGLKSRNMLSNGNGKYVINIDIIKLDCNKFARREAHVEWNVTMIDKASNQTVYSKTIISNKVNGSVMEISFSQKEQLQAIAQEALQDAVHQLLKDSAFTSKFN